MSGSRWGFNLWATLLSLRLHYAMLNNAWNTEILTRLCLGCWKKFLLEDIFNLFCIHACFLLQPLENAQPWMKIHLTDKLCQDSTVWVQHQSDGRCHLNFSIFQTFRKKTYIFHQLTIVCFFPSCRISLSARFFIFFYRIILSVEVFQLQMGAKKKYNFAIAVCPLNKKCN